MKLKKIEIKNYVVMLEVYLLLIQNDR